MKYFRSIGSAAFACALGFALLPSLRADEWNKKTTITVNEPVQVPSCCTPDHTITLQPGEYVIALVDSLSDRHIVRIFDKNQEHVITTILAIPNYRLQPTDKTVIQFWEVPAGHTKAIRAWFYPGDNFGQEFAYEKKTAVEIAALVKTPVPAIEVETKEVEELKSAPVVVVDESGATKAFKAEPAPQPVVAAAQPEPAPAPAPVVVAQTPVQTLPHTASNMPLVGLIGLLSLGLFAAMSTVSRRRNSSRG
ncbi:MAG: hypothetical protein ABI693_29145 [Bryobacteraceae bacterium]